MSLWLDSGSHVVVATLNTTIASSNKSGPGIAFWCVLSSSKIIVS